MPVQTTLQPKYLIRVIAMTVISLVFGLWGVYDYYVKIPRQQRMYEYGRVYEAVHNALNATPFGSEPARAMIRAADELVTAEAGMVDEALGGLKDRPTKPTIEEIRGELKEQGLEQWMAELTLFKLALIETAGRTEGSTASDVLVQVVDHVSTRVSQTAEISAPSTFDRAVQWVYIMCLPCVPYFLWVWFKARKRSYRLDDDGTLSTPAGTWTVSEIADVDMSRWMAKSIAQVIHTDGRRVGLDDYVYKNTDAIVGAIATRLHPDEWDEQARPKKSATEDETAEAADNPRPGSADEID